ncbi:MAG: cytochrome b/b6 domain-containing protein [Xanthomonadales bacterium]|nr:cytochrome b/b6 domain-containing protein [Xanthomonadales bacterium]
MSTGHSGQKELEGWIKPPNPELYINPLPVRIWHWLNALGFVVLILTGIQIRYANLFNVLSFETAVKTHNWVAFTVIANYFVWLGFYLFSDKITVYHPELNMRKFFDKAFKQIIYYSYGIFRGEKSPHKVQPYDKFNPMQSITYQIVMLLVVPIQFITGIMMWDIKRFEAPIAFLGGIRSVDTVHVLIFIFFVSFTMIHAYMGALGHTPSAHFKEMFTGYEEE